MTEKQKGPERNTGIEVVSKIGEFEITQNPRARVEASVIRHQMLVDFTKNTGQDVGELIELLQKHPQWLDPVFIYEEHVLNPTQEDRMPIFIAASAWDFNGSLVFNRNGFSDKETFDPAPRREIGEQQGRLGSFVIASALTTEQMVFHMVKEKGLAPKTFLACENGKAWAIPIQKDGKTVFVEYRQPLNPEQEKALDSVKEISGRLAEILRKNGLIAFVNEQKFSKCTIECAGNGRDWYTKTIKEFVLPFLAKNGAQWDGKNITFSINGKKFSVSPTPDTWEIDPVEGTDIIGKVRIRQTLYNTFSQLIHSKVPAALFKLLTGGDSVAFGGSDSGLTDNGPATVGFIVPNRRREPKETLTFANQASNLGRRYWLNYTVDDKGVHVVAGPGIAPAFFMESVRKILPHIYISTEVFSAALVERLTSMEGFKFKGEYDIRDSQKPPVLYVFPEDMTQRQREMFLNSEPDILPADQEKVLARLKMEAGV